MRDFKGCAIIATLLVGSLNAEHLGQQFDPRERIEASHRVHLSQRAMRSRLKNQAVHCGLKHAIVLFVQVMRPGREGYLVLFLG